MKRIGVDCRLAGQKHAGIGRYTQNLVQRLVENPEFEWVLFFSDIEQAQEVLPKKYDNTTEVFVPIKHYSLKEQTRLPKIFSEQKLDLLHIPHFNVPIFYPGKIVVTIHDLLWHEQRGNHVTTLPAWKYWLKYWAYIHTVKTAVKKAKAIFVPSKTVVETLGKYYPKTKNKTILTYEGVAEIFLQQKKIKSKIKKQLIYTGSLYPHKNIEVVLKALKNLPEFSLKLVGARNIFQQETMELVKKHKVEKQVDFLGRLSDKKLIELYSESFAFVFPSFSEGFGLPGLEAMATNLPVIASEIPIFKEIYGDAAAYFNPKSSAELVEIINILEPSRKDLIKNGQKIIEKYSWETMVNTTINEYKKIIQK